MAFCFSAVFLANLIRMCTKIPPQGCAYRVGTYKILTAAGQHCGVNTTGMDKGSLTMSQYTHAAGFMWRRYIKLDLEHPSNFLETSRKLTHLNEGNQCKWAQCTTGSNKPCFEQCLQLPGKADSQQETSVFHLPLCAACPKLVLLILRELWWQIPSSLGKDWQKNLNKVLLVKIHSYPSYRTRSLETILNIQRQVASSIKVLWLENLITLENGILLSIWLSCTTSL